MMSDKDVKSGYEYILKQAMALPLLDRLRLISALANQLTGAEIPTQQTEAERIAAIDEICGKYRHINTSVDDFLTRKREEIDLEDTRCRTSRPEDPR